MAHQDQSRSADHAHGDHPPSVVRTLSCDVSRPVIAGALMNVGPSVMHCSNWKSRRVPVVALNPVLAVVGETLPSNNVSCGNFVDRLQPVF
jgi:hypothetical protein